MYGLDSYNGCHRVHTTFMSEVVLYMFPFFFLANDSSASRKLFGFSISSPFRAI
jgi:hypothetical protein